MRGEAEWQSDAGKRRVEWMCRQPPSHSLSPPVRSASQRNHHRRSPLRLTDCLFIMKKSKEQLFPSFAVHLSLYRLICVSLGLGKHSQAPRFLFSNPFYLTLFIVAAGLCVCVRIAAQHLTMTHPQMASITTQLSQAAGKGATSPWKPLW